MSIQTASIVRIGSEEEAIRRAKLYAASIAAGAIERDRYRRHPASELRELAATGLLAITVPAAAGGLGASFETLVEVLRTIAQADPSIGQLALPHFVVTRFLLDIGTPEQQSFFFGRALAGARFGNASAERGGRTVRDSTARVTSLDAGRVRVDARKYYATGALGADWVSVIGADDSGLPVAVLVPGEAAGLQVLDDWTSFGQRSTISGGVIVDGVVAPSECLLPIHQLFVAPGVFGPHDQITHAAVDVGIAAAALDDAARFVVQHSRPWPEAGVDRAADEQYLVVRFGQLTARLHAAEALLARGAAAIDRAQTAGLAPDAVARASIAVDEAKAFGGEVSVEIASALFELTGTASTDEGHGLDRHWRNARTHTLHDPARWRYHHVGRSILDATAATADAGARDASTSVTPLDETERADRINSAEGAVRIAAAFAKQFAPGASARDSSGGFPGDELRAIARSGLLAITVPTEFGGIGAGVETVVEVARLLSEADPSIGQLTLPQFVLFRVILELGSEDQKRRFFDRVLDGKRFGNATQPSKRPGARLETTIARRIDPLTIRLDGEKYYTTGSVNADYIVVAATDEDGEAVSVVVAGDAPGLDVVEDDWDSFGQRSTVSGTVRLNGVLASADDVLYSRALFGVPNLLLAIDQIQHGAVDVGIARAALADAAWFVQERANPARESGLDRAAEDPHTIYRFGQLRTQLDAAEALLRQSARIIDAIDASGDRSVEAIDAATVAGNQLKAFAAEVGSEIASAVFELTGTSSTDKRYGLDRHWRNVRTHSINVATRWRYDQIGKSTLATFPASSVTRAQIIADEAGEVTA